MKEFLMQTYTLILPIVLGYIIWLLKNQKHYRDANSKGTMILLKVKLFEYHDKYMELGSIPPYAFENFCDMYESYHELGGNGTGTKMYEEIKDLHLNKKRISPKTQSLAPQDRTSVSKQSRLPVRIRHISTEFTRKTSDGQIGHSTETGRAQKEKDCKLKRSRSWLLNSLSIHTSRTEAG